jgi:3-oxoacyl-[acyl-carrier protein] reductase
MDFTGQVCVVTGAGGRNGIGFNCARAFGGLGAKIAIISTTDRIYQRVGELAAEGVQAKGYIADLMDRSQVEKSIDQIARDYGRIDVLVNNAGMAQIGNKVEGMARSYEQNEQSQIKTEAGISPVQPGSSYLSQMAYETWDRGIDRNLNICFNVTRRVLPYMIAANYGRIVNVASVTGPLVSNPGDAVYSAAKAAVVGMGKAVAIEVAINNITINSVLPGWVTTGSQSKEGAEAGRNTPLKRSAEPDEIGNAVVFLASKEASYITGQTLVVDGGNSIQEYKGASEFYY